MKALVVNIISYTLIPILGILIFTGTNVKAKPCIDRDPTNNPYRVFINKLKGPSDSITLNKVKERTLKGLESLAQNSPLSRKISDTEGKDPGIEVFLCQERIKDDVNWFNPRYHSSPAEKNHKKKIILELMGSVKGSRVKDLKISTLEFYTLTPRTERNVEESEITLYKFKENIFALTEEKSIYSAYLYIGLGMYHFRSEENPDYASTYLYSGSVEIGSVIDNLIKTIEDAERKKKIKEKNLEKKMKTRESGDFVNSEQMEKEITRLKNQITAVKDQIGDMEFSIKNLEKYKKNACIFWKKAAIKRDIFTKTVPGMTIEDCVKG